MDLGKDIQINYSFCTIRYSVIVESEDDDDGGGCDDRGHRDSSNFARSTHPYFPFVDVVSFLFVNYFLVRFILNNFFFIFPAHFESFRDVLLCIEKQ